MSQPTSFGSVLKRFRRAAGLTQEALAERAGYSTVYISMLERDRRQPLPSTVDLLGEALRLDGRERSALQIAARSSDVASASSSGLVGRNHEVELVAQHLSGTGPPLLLLAGEPGIGKTRLLREASLLGTLQGWTVLEGGSHRRGGQEPYAPILGALQRAIGERSEEDLQRALQGCAWLVRLLPELAGGAIGPLPDWSLPPEQQRRLMLEAVGTFLKNIAGPSGTLLVLDDLQWAAGDALDLLVILLHRPDVPVRVVAAYRDVEAREDDHLTMVLGDLAHAEMTTHHTLKPLHDDEAGELLDQLLESTPDREWRERLLLRSGGIPFFLVSFAQQFRPDDSARTSIPWDVAQGIRQRVRSLPLDAREILSVAAVVGRHAQHGVLMTVSGKSEDTVLAALDATCRARLLMEEKDGAYSFSHDVIREVLEGDLTAARRRVLHRRIAEALVRSAGEPPVETVAYHYSRSDAVDKAVEYLRLAGERAQEQYAHATAEAYYSDLVRRLDDLGWSLPAAEAREQLGAILGTLARYDKALALLEGAAETYRAAGELEAEGRAVAQIGRIHYVQGEAEEGITRLEPVLERLALSQGALAALNVALAPLYLARGRYQDQMAAAESGGALARTVGDKRLVAEAEVWRGCALNQLGYLTRGRRVQEEAIPLAEAANELTSLSHALNDVAHFYEIGGEFTKSRHYKERALAVAERVGDPAGIANMAFRCGQNAFLRGDWDTARSDYVRAATVMQSVDAPSIAPYPLFGLGYLELAEGNGSEARAHAEASIAMAERSGDVQVLRAGTGLLAELDLLAGRPEEARDRLLAVDPAEEGIGLHSTYAILAEAYLCSGDRVQAAHWARAGIDHSTERQNRISMVDALRVHAMTEGDERWEESAQSLDRALSLTRTMGYPYGEGRILLTAGALHLQRGDTAQGVAFLQEAAAVFDRLGARKLALQARERQTPVSL